MRRYLSLLLVFGCVQPVRADEPNLDAVKPFVDEQTVAVVRLAVGRLDAEAVTAEVRKLTGDSRHSAEGLREFKAVQDLLTKVGARDAYVVVSLADVPSQPAFVVLPVADAAGAARRLREAKLFPQYQFEALGRVVVGASPLTLQRLRRQRGAPRPEFGPALAAAGDAAVRVAIAPSADQRRVVESLVPNLPAALGGGPAQTLTRGLRWLAVGIQPPPQLSLRVVAQAADAGSAEAVSELASRALAEIGRQPDVRKGIGNFDRLAAQLKPRVEGDRVVVAPDAQALAALLTPLVARVQQAAGRAESANNLKQIALAMHNYHDVHKAFPAVANFDKDGKPLLSWRVHLLPFLNQADLYGEFHLDEPWDSEHNKTLIARMPEVFRSPVSHAAPGQTTYEVPVGQAMIFTGDPKGTPMRAITDGTSNTIMLVEVNNDKAVTWTKPEDWKPDANKPLDGLPGAYPNGFLAAFADGSVHFLSATMDPRNFKALLTRGGGEVVTVE